MQQFLLLLLMGFLQQQHTAPCVVYGRVVDLLRAAGARRALGRDDEWRKCFLFFFFFLHLYDGLVFVKGEIFKFTRVSARVRAAFWIGGLCRCVVYIDWMR